MFLDKAPSTISDVMPKRLENMQHKGTKWFLLITARILGILADIVFMVIRFTMYAINISVPKYNFLQQCLAELVPSLVVDQ